MTDTKKKTGGTADELSREASAVIKSMLETGTIFEGAVIIVGFSGGPDSLCLLHGLNELSHSLDLSLVPVHVNHHLRGEKADEEQENAVRMCEKMGLECLVYDADCKAMAEDLGISTEEAGRTVRYQIFDDVAAQLVEQGVDPEGLFIAVAHNADDQSETVLFRLMRGTGVHGLAGISAVRSSDAGFVIVRPLIDTTRESIEKYIKHHKLHPNRDESNEVADVTRNKIRLKLIPYIEKNYNPNIKESLRKFAEIASIDDSFMEAVAAELCGEIMDIDAEREALVLDITELREQHIAIIRRVVLLCLKPLGIVEGASYELVMNIINLIFSSNPSAYVNLPAGMIAQREYDKIVFMPEDKLEKKNPAEAYRLVPQVLRRQDFHPDEDEIYAAFDFDAFNEKYPGKAGSLELRTRREGDFIAIKGGSKKLQDFFVDEKIVQSERDNILVVAIGGEILWIVPNSQLSTAKQREHGRFSQNYQLKDTSERVLFLELVEEIW